MVRRSRVSWSLVRAAVFYYLLERILANLKWLPVWPLPDGPFDPVDTSDVAAYLVDCVDDGKRGLREEIGGPETPGLVELARQYQSARGIHRPILALHPSEVRARKLGLVPARGRHGRKTWSAWLNENAIVSPARGLPRVDTRSQSS